MSVVKHHRVALLVAFLLTLSVGAVHASIVVPPPPPPPVILGPTSLETMVMPSGTNGLAGGTVSVTNVGENVAKIMRVEVIIEARKGNQWQPVAQDASYEIAYVPVGGTASFPFTITYPVDASVKAYRAVSRVTLENHPTGIRVFVSRSSF